METSLAIAAALIATAILIARTRGTGGSLVRTVYEWEHGLAYRGGRFERILPPGRYLVGLFSGREIFTLRKAEAVDAVGLADLTSRDKLAFRASATFTYRIVDPRAAYEGFHQERLRPDVSAALVQLAAARTLDEVLADRASLDAALLDLVGELRCGCEITSATILTITLPPEIRRAASGAERARLEGLAALGRARGEQAALRSLANAARLLKGNPELLNLRILQAFSAGAGRGTLVLGPGGLASTPSGPVIDP